MTSPRTPRQLGQLKRQGARRLRAEWEQVLTPELFEGIRWYPAANSWVKHLAQQHNLTVPVVAGVAATLSPRLPWSRAIGLTERMLGGEDISGQALGRQVAKAQTILTSGNPYEIVSGPKVTSFFHNLMGEYDWVTIDKWSFNQVTGLDYNAGDNHLLERVGVYEAYADSFRQIAIEERLDTAAVQAILWIHTRGKA